MKKITVLGVALATVASVALVSCQKDGARITEFTATVEHCTDASGKVLMDGNVLRWTDGDQIAVWGSDGMGTYTTTNVGEYVTTFNFTEGDDPGDPTYTAIYPASLAQRQAVILLPPVQTSTDGSLQQFPMMARSSNSELVFKNLCGALRLRLQASGKSVVGIELAGGSSKWGLYQLNYNNGEPTLSLVSTSNGNSSPEVMLSIVNPQDITTAHDFYVSLPPATYGAGFTIKIYASDGSVCTKTITSGHSFRIERSGIFTVGYRILMGDRYVHFHLKAAMVEENEGSRLIVGLNDIDAQVRQEEEYTRRLAKAQSEANIDFLTGVKNKHAYAVMEASLNSHIEKHNQEPFAVVVFDVNNLKTVNDSLGHRAGDNYLCESCKIICDIFKRSPVFRIGGDEFAIIAQGRDYDRVEELIAKVDDHNAKAMQNDGIVIACGMARYDNDANVAAVFERADHNMYENKNRLKEEL